MGSRKLFRWGLLTVAVLVAAGCSGTATPTPVPSVTNSPLEDGMSECSNAPYVLFKGIGFSEPEFPPSIREPDVEVVVGPSHIDAEADPPMVDLLFYTRGDVSADDSEGSRDVRDLTVGDTATFRGYTVTILAICGGSVGIDVTQG